MLRERERGSALLSTLDADPAARASAPSCASASGCAIAVSGWLMPLPVRRALCRLGGRLLERVDA
jgi:hypothetical protein